MTSTRAVPSSFAWWATSPSRLGEKGESPPLPSRAVCTCKSGGKRRNSISQVVLVDGTSIPKCLGITMLLRLDGVLLISRSTRVERSAALLHVQNIDLHAIAHDHVARLLIARARAEPLRRHRHGQLAARRGRAI